ncbi:lipopolysaccharide core heptosyltransferase RfaQ [bacterium BMS3Abin04]|nr:lipopolysaccharide core heptosyltransferase RfaQ [bacterium BMS3Abin04]
MIIDKDSVKKILVIKLRGIGDVVLSTIVLDSLKANFPGAKIDFLTEKASFPVIKGLPQISEVIEFNRKSTIERLKLFPKIRANKYNLVLDLFSNPATAQLTFLSGARYRAGFPYRGRKYAYNLFGPSERGKFHAGLLHLEVLNRIGLKISTQNLYFNLDKFAYLFADKYVNTISLKNSLVVGLIPSGGWSSKRCEPNKFSEIGDEIAEKFGAEIMILWGPGDLDDAEKIKAFMKHESFLAPKTTLREMGALISKCAFVIANDSGPMHIAAALNIPVLSLHGPTDPKLQGPLGDMHEWIRLEELDCIGCNLLECPKNHECFTELPVNDVIKKVQILIEKNHIIIS